MAATVDPPTGTIYCLEWYSELRHPTPLAAGLPVGSALSEVVRVNHTEAVADRYQSRVMDLLREVFERESRSIRAAAEVVAQVFRSDGLLYVFGSGHSHMFAEEAFYRAGGPVQICPMLHPPYMLHEGAVRSTELERMSGEAKVLYERYSPDPSRDGLLVVSNSGVNALPTELARHGSEDGLPVIAITSVSYASSIDRPGPRLHEIADVVVDNHCPPGDALVELADELPAAGPGSTVVGLAVLNALLLEACGRCFASKGDVSVWLSANMPGAFEHNREFVERYRGRVPHLDP